MPDSPALLAHALVTLAYRTRKVLDDASPDFGAFDAGAGVRTPSEIVRHVTDVLSFASARLGKVVEQADPLATLADERDRLYRLLESTRGQLDSNGPLDPDLAERLLQGPLADALTHVGQLALLRRLAGAPVARENYFAAEMKTPAASAPAPRTREPAAGTEAPQPVSAATAEHYVWGTVCDGWHLARGPALSIIQERMPPQTAEARHQHRASRQFFYVLEGTLLVEVDGTEHTLSAGEGVEVSPGLAHQVHNVSSTPAGFLVVSQPPSHGDRHPAPRPLTHPTPHHP